MTGVDISPESVKYARQIAHQADLEANFIVSDVMDLQVQATYDIVFASTGVFCWIPDIDKFAAIVRKLLKPGGFFYVHDGHPVRDIFEKTEGGLAVAQNDYFQTEVWEYDRFTDYATKDLKIQVKNYQWGWTVGSIITAFCRAGMRIAFLHEFPQFFYSGYTGYDVETYHLNNSG